MTFLISQHGLRRPSWQPYTVCSQSPQGLCPCLSVAMPSKPSILDAANVRSLYHWLRLLRLSQEVTATQFSVTTNSWSPTSGHPQSFLTMLQFPGSAWFHSANDSIKVLCGFKKIIIIIITVNCLVLCLLSNCEDYPCSLWLLSEKVTKETYSV